MTNVIRAIYERLVVRDLRHPGLVSAGIAVALVSVLWVKVEIEVAHDRERMRFLEAEIQKLEPQIADVAELRERIRDLLARNQIIETLQTYRYAARALEEVARRRPEGASLVTLRNAGRNIRLTGYATSERAATAYRDNLARSPRFQDAKLAEVQPEGARVRFTLDMRLKDPVFR